VAFPAFPTISKQKSERVPDLRYAASGMTHIPTASSLRLAFHVIGLAASKGIGTHRLNRRE